MTSRSPVAPAAHQRPYGSLLDVLNADAVTTVFQPLIDLHTERLVGYEALARGPLGTRWESPAALFTAAAAVNRVPQLDWACRAAAFRAATAAGLPDDVPLFVNVEPASIGTPCPPHLAETVSAAAGRLRIVYEVTEREVARDPAGLLAAVSRARAGSAGIALDDVGAEPASLAMMPLLDPDVIKLDLRLIQGRTSPDVAAIVTAVLAHAERTGARILAEGIEEPRHIDIARTLGASLGQGYLLGRPAPLPPHPGRGARAGALPFRPAGRLHPQDTPFSVVSAVRPTVRGTKALLLPLSMHIEQRSQDAEPGVLLSCFQEARHFTSVTRRRYDQLARNMILTGVLGVGMPAVPAAGVLGGRLPVSDALRGEWDVIVVGPQFAAALVSRDLGDDGPDRDRRFDAVITHDRDLVIKAAQSLVSRLLVGALPGPT
jgi:EAL domain-containing protein (putative c-di-GMP-specific phosphodiesterase class I)